MKKKLILLGAMQMHLPLIERARERGIDIVTVDWTETNPGHRLASKAYFDSTTDADAVERIMRTEQADGILTFNSDPAALTAAIVAERCGLPGSGVKAVQIMSEKDRFREFLKESGFNVPAFASFTDYEEMLERIDEFNFPVMLKPVDSSGSKGVVRVDEKENLEEEFLKAMEFSRCKRVIVEEFIEAAGPQLHGDGFVADGELQFLCLGDHHFDSAINNLVPVSTTFPSTHTPEEVKSIEEEVRRFIRMVGLRQGGINVEARISKRDGKPYLIETGARNGGNFTPIVIGEATGFNFIDASLDAALGLSYRTQKTHEATPAAYMIVHSAENGILKSVNISPDLSNKIIARYDYLTPGQSVNSFRGANSAIGVILVKFNNESEMWSIIERMDDEIAVELECP